MVCLSFLTAEVAGTLGKEKNIIHPAFSNAAPYLAVEIVDGREKITGFNRRVHR